MHPTWTAQDIFRISGAYWQGCALQAGVELDLFTTLGKEPLTGQALAERLGCDVRACGMLVTALVAMGLLERQGEQVALAQGAKTFLSKDSPDYVGFIVSHHHHIMPAWVRLAEAVRTGRSTAERSSVYATNDADREAFLMGMFNVAQQQAEQIAGALDLSGRSRLIDVGGGPGTYAAYFCLANPQLRVTVFDLPESEPFARKIMKRFDLEDRVAFAGGNFLKDPLPKGYDVAWVSQVLHGENPAGAQQVINNAAASLNPGGLLCVQEFMVNDDRNGPMHPALFSLNMLVQTANGGQAYTPGEIIAMMRNAGLGSVRELDVVLPSDCRILMGEMPHT